MPHRASDGSAAIFTWTVTGIAAGFVCDAVLARRFLPALGLSVLALLFHEGVVFFLNLLLADAAFSMGLWVLVTVGLSLLACPVLYLLCRAIGKVGG